MSVSERFTVGLSLRRFGKPTQPVWLGLVFPYNRSLVFNFNYQLLGDFVFFFLLSDKSEYDLPILESQNALGKNLFNSLEILNESLMV